MADRSGPEAQRPAVPRTPIQAIDRAIALLDVVAEGGPHGMTLGALAESTGLAPSTARTILSSLVMHGLIAQSGSGSSYTLGSRFFELNRRFAMQADLSAVAAPVLRALWERTNETVHLAVLQGNRRVDLAVLVSPQLLRVDPTSTGYLDASASPLYKTAAGKVLFAGLSRTDRLGMLRTSAWQDETPPAPEDLMAAMDAVVTEGYATNLEEEAAGVCGVAAPVHDQSGATIAAVCLGYPSTRHTTSHAGSLRDEVIAAAAELSLLLGADPDRAAR
ncbi:IclR family transcriptional regulator [Pseudactinotalea suaedae]|uniref:IclR family transcriptional regulator n=1 Tax=Pseudactinotalea suaedae TaxID=1524924 RepID=UPI0012E2A240|nr:IclR family transcriptional regulator [Pseudactinotalea suaedae]